MNADNSYWRLSAFIGGSMFLFSRISLASLAVQENNLAVLLALIPRRLYDSSQGSSLMGSLRAGAPQLAHAKTA
jgi:hypothetical protein